VKFEETFIPRLFQTVTADHMPVPETATMTSDQYFDEDPIEAGIADSDVRSMARRQFGISLVVGFALLAVAGLIAVRATPGAPVEMAARHRIIKIEAPQSEFAQPAQAAPVQAGPTKG
jgi:hypothetical protein